MDAQELRNLQEAYMGVYDSQEKLDEISDRLARATTKKRERDVEKTLSNYDSDKSRMLATQISAANRNKNLMKDREKRKERLGEQVDLYDIILSHLLDEGYAETQGAAEAIMVNMSEEWREDIMEISDKKVAAVGRRRQANVDKAMSSNEYISDKPGATQNLATKISQKSRFDYLNKKRERRGG
jgi:hypothetical protein